MAIFAIYKYDFRLAEEGNLFIKGTTDKLLDKAQELFNGFLTGDKPFPIQMPKRDKTSVRLDNEVTCKRGDVCLLLICNEKSKKIMEKKDEQEIFYHPGCYVIIDNRKGVANIAIERTPAFDSNPDKVCQLLEKAINDKFLIEEIGLKIEIRSKVREATLWEMVDHQTHDYKDDDIVDYYYFAQFLAPSAFDVGGSIKYTTTSAPTGRVVASIKPAYTMTDAEYAQAKLFYDGEIEKIIALVPQGLGEYETALLLHDYICATYKYSEPGEYVYDVYSILSGGAGVCEAYTKLYIALLAECGIKSYPVTSEEINHAWNEVRLDGIWYLVDVTWGDPVPDSLGKAYHGYFIGSTEAFRADHGDDFVPVFAADDTSLDTSDFHSANTPFAFLDGEVYGAIGENIYALDFSTGDMTEIFTVGARWPAGTEGSYWANKFSGVAAYGGLLIYNSADSFWTLDPFSGAEEIIYTPELDSSLNIYGCYNFGDTLYYVTGSKSSPNSDATLHTLQLPGLFAEPSYNVRFLNWDGTVISEDSYAEGEQITVPADPTRPDDETYKYVFAAWEPQVQSEAYADADYTAVYTAEYIDYTVKFLDWDESVISEKTYHYGEEIEIPDDPARPGDGVNEYVFAGWDKEVSATCAGDATYNATYVLKEDACTVTFLDWDGTPLSSAVYRRGETPVAPAGPTRAADNTYTYVFTGWDKEIVPADGDASYTAVYEGRYIEYTVLFTDWDRKTISEQILHYGDAVTVPEDPARPADNTYTYVFSGWDPAPEAACNGSAVYTATYTAEYIDYTVKFLDWDESVISEKTYHYGDETEIPADPARPDDGDYTYTFTGWDKEVTACAGDATYTAVYESTPKKADYMLGDVNGNGKIDASDYAMYKRAYLRTYTLNAEQLMRGDINGNGKTDASEYAMIKRHYLGTYRIPQPGDSRSA